MMPSYGSRTADAVNGFTPRAWMPRGADPGPARPRRKERVPHGHWFWALAAALGQGERENELAESPSLIPEKFAIFAKFAKFANVASFRFRESGEVLRAARCG